MASECEWLLAPSEIIKDFEKLLVIKSSTKLMIFASSGTDDSQRRIFDALKKSFLSYKHHVTGERYVFIDFAPASRRSAFWLEIGKTTGFLEVLPDLQWVVGNKLQL